MKQLISYILIAGGVYLSMWLYHHQLGAIPYILLSLFLFFLAYKEFNKKNDIPDKKGKNAPALKKNPQKKAGIVT